MLYWERDLEQVLNRKEKLFKNQTGQFKRKRTKHGITFSSQISRKVMGKERI
jgi:hypothetical protein